MTRRTFFFHLRSLGVKLTNERVHKQGVMPLEYDDQRIGKTCLTLAHHRHLKYVERVIHRLSALAPGSVGIWIHRREVNEDVGAR